jgi:hypothetical protein
MRLNKDIYLWPALLILSFLLLLTSLSPATAAVPREECSDPPAGTIFCEDFEGPNPKANFDDYDGNLDSENQIIADSGPSEDASNKVIRFRIPAGQSGGSDLIKILPGNYDTLYARWYFMYEPGFNFGARNHGGGLIAASDRNYIGRSGIRPDGSDLACFQLQYLYDTALPFAYSYYRGMYQDCVDPNGSCWGDSFPCVYDDGTYYCTKPEDRPTGTLPNLVAGQWYCYEQMIDMGTASANGSGATGRITQWLDGNMIGDNTNLWLRTVSTLKLNYLWLSLYHHDGSHSAVGELIDNIVVSTQRIGCGTSCADRMALIQGEDIYYTSIRAAYANAENGQTILLQALTFNEDPNLNLNIDIALRGGYDCNFSSDSGYSTISGNVTIGGAGKVTIENLILR